MRTINALAFPRCFSIILSLINKRKKMAEVARNLPKKVKELFFYLFRISQHRKMLVYLVEIGHGHCGRTDKGMRY